MFLAAFSTGRNAFDKTTEGVLAPCKPLLDPELMIFDPQRECLRWSLTLHEVMCHWIPAFLRLLQEDVKVEAKKSKGELEFENQLAMAMMASVGPEAQKESKESNRQPQAESEEVLKLKRRHSRGRGVAVIGFQQAMESYPDQVLLTVEIKICVS